MHDPNWSEIMKSTKTLVATLAAVFALAGVVLGCGDDEEPTAGSAAKQSSGAEPGESATPQASSEAPEDVVVMPPMPQRQPKSPGEELAIKIELPDFYPSDGPVYPDTQPSKAFVKGNRVNLMFGTDDSTETVLDFLNAEIVALGWSNADVQRMGDVIAIQATKPGRNLDILVSVVDSGLSTQATLIAIGITD